MSLSEDTTTEHPKSFLSKDHLTILLERGITKQTAIAARLRSVSSREAKDILGFDPHSGGILIPYTDPQTGATRTFRFRPDKPLVIKEKAAKYLTPRGGSNLIYFPPEISEALKDCTEPLIVTEGEFKALAAAQHGLLCVGLTGVWGWKTRADGQSQAIPDLDLIEVRGRAVTIVFDSDVCLNGQVRRARHDLGKELYKRGAVAVYTVDLPAPNGSKVGLDDYLKSDGLDAYLGLDVSEQPPTDIPPFMEPISTLFSAPEEPLEWGIEGIQPIGANGWRIASPKVGKSWAMIEEAYCLSTAQPVYGHFEVPQPRRVMVIEEEDPKRRVRRRIERIVRAHGGRTPADDSFKVSIKKGFRLDDPKWREVFEFEIKSFMPEFCYLDVFNRLHAKDINDAQAMSEMVLFLDKLNRDYGVAFIILHHDRKNGQSGDPHNEIMGSRVLGGFADATLFFARTREKGVLHVSVALKDEPESGFEPEFLIQLKDTEDGNGTFFEYIGAAPEKKATNALREKIKSILETATDWLTIKEVSDKAEVSKNTAKEHLDALVDLKQAQKDRRGKAYVYRIAQGAQI